MSDFYVEKIVKARKEHKCIWCSTTIQRDETYIRCGGVFQGDFGMRKECIKCNDTISKLISEGMDVDDGLDIAWMIDCWKECRCYKCENFDGDEDCDMTHAIRCENYKAVT
jgi:hypothetical protein